MATLFLLCEVSFQRKKSPSSLQATSSLTGGRSFGPGRSGLGLVDQLFQLEHVRGRRAIDLDFPQDILETREILAQDRGWELVQRVQHEEAFGLVGLADQLLVQIAVVFVFAGPGSAIPRAVVESVDVAGTDILQQRDERLRGTLGAVGNAVREIGLDAPHDLPQLFRHVLDLQRVPAAGHASAPSILVKLNEQVSGLRLGLVKVDGRARARRHGFPETGVHIVIVHGETEQGRLEIPLHHALLGRAWLAGRLGEIAAEILR